MDVYSTVIQLRDDLPEEKLQEIQKLCQAAFTNRGGTVPQKESGDPYCLIFEGQGEEAWGCLQLGILDLDDVEDFKDYVAKWDWIDYDEPDESHDVLEALAIPVFVG